MYFTTFARDVRSPLDRQDAAPARGLNPAYEAATGAQGPNRDRQQHEIAGIQGPEPPETPTTRRCASVVLRRLVPSSPDLPCSYEVGTLVDA